MRSKLFTYLWLHSGKNSIRMNKLVLSVCVENEEMTKIVVAVSKIVCVFLLFLIFTNTYLKHIGVSIS